MQNVLNSVKNFLVAEDGPTAVEYAVMLALIIVVCLTAIQAEVDATAQSGGQATGLLSNPPVNGGGTVN